MNKIRSPKQKEFSRDKLFVSLEINKKNFPLENYIFFRILISVVLSEFWIFFCFKSFICKVNNPTLIFHDFREHSTRLQLVRISSESVGLTTKKKFSILFPFDCFAIRLFGYFTIIFSNISFSVFPCFYIAKYCKMMSCFLSKRIGFFATTLLSLFNLHILAYYN